MTSHDANVDSCAGLMEKIIDLLQHQLTRHMGLQILLVFIHDGSRMQDIVLDKIAGHCRTISRLVQDWSPTDRHATELAIVVMAHSLRFYLSTLDPAAGNRVLDVGLHDILQVMFSVLRAPDPSASVLTHTLMLLVVPAQYFPALCGDVNDLNALLVALFRAEDISIRVSALEGVLRVCGVDSEPDTCIVDLQYLAQSVQYAESSTTSPVQLTSSEHHPQWVHESDSSQLYSLSKRYIEAMSQAARDCDLVALGQSIAELVQHSTMVVEGSWTQIDSDPVHRLPFARWTDCLPECARALRLGETDHDLDAADVDLAVDGGDMTENDVVEHEKGVLENPAPG